MPNQRTGLDHDSKAQVEGMRAANVSRLLERLGHVPDELMVQVDAKLRIHLGV
ncbi:type II toxin-antitoxin system PemK/MazF family toxin [Deinococcus sp.]|uniref:type II toxin-antitoxin system PemK/MazF family toxin n=1 Tax=Deinococcus sp. TaxID=47478 RepID=UPI003C79D105